MSVFSSKKTQQGVYAAEEAKEKTQTESKQKACMGMEMEMPDSATFISGDICFFCHRKPLFLCLKALKILQKTVDK